MRAWLQDMLWGSRDLPQAQSSLRRELANLKSAIADPGGLIRSDHLRVWLDLERVQIDAPPRGYGKDRASGEFLEGLDLANEEGFEDWLRTQRASFAARPIEPSPIPRDVHPVELDAADSLRLAMKRPSIVVLPFTQHDAAELPNIADGVVEEITIVLSRYPSLLVIASGTGLSFRGSTINHQSIAEELGVRYLLEGSVRAAGDRVRVSVRLIDGVEGHQLWADRFEDSLVNIFDMQDRVALKVAQLIDSSIEKAEMRRAGSRPINKLDAYQLYWQANAAFREWTPESMARAIDGAEQILTLEPENPWALSLIGFCHASSFASGWSEDPIRQRELAISLTGRALQRGWDDSQVLGYAAGSLAQAGGDIDAAHRMIERALELNPGAAAIQFWGGWINICAGDPDKAIELFQSALRLNPRSAVRPFHEAGIGIAYFLRRDFEATIRILTDVARSLPEHPPTLLVLAAALAYVDRGEQAREIARRFDNTETEGVVAVTLRDLSHRELLREGIANAMRLP